MFVTPARVAVARVRVMGVVAAGEAEATAIARWQIYLENLPLKFDGSRAALWSRLGDKGERAAALAKADGRITLESVLQRTDFFQRYTAEFGGTQNTVTGRVWQM